MPVVVPRETIKPQKVMDDGAYLPYFQKNMTGGMDSYYTIPITPSAPTDAIGSGKSVYFDLERDETGLINDICVRFNVSCTTSDVELSPTPYLFQQIRIWSSKGSGDLLKTIYPEEFLIWNQITQDEESRDRWSKLSNWHINKLKQDGASEKIHISEKTKLKAGETRDIYLQLPALFFQLDAIDMKHIRSDLRLEFVFDTAAKAVVSGSANNVTLNNIHLLIRSFNEESYDNAMRQTAQNKNKHKYLYLDCERIQVNDKTLQSQTTTRFALDQFVGKTGMLALYVKPSTSPTASDYSLWNFQDLGSDATFDITNSAGQSLLGNGTAVKSDQINNIFASQTGNPHLEGVYIIPFCEDIKQTMLAIPNGVFSMMGLHDYLEITFGSAPVQEVQQITTDQLGVTGSYRLGFSGGTIDSTELSYDSSVTDIQNALSALPVCKELNYSVTVDNTLENATTQNFTFNANSGKPSEELGNLTYIGNQTPRVTGSSVVTQGSRGFTSGNNYEVTILMYKFKEICIDTNGNITCKEI